MDALGGLSNYSNCYNRTGICHTLSYRQVSS